MPWHSNRAINKLYPKPSKCQIKGCANTPDVWHHKDGNWRNNRRTNLVAVCNSCHGKIHNPPGIQRGPTKSRKGIPHRLQHLPEADLVEILRQIEIGERIPNIAQRYSVSVKSINRLVRNFQK